VVFRGTMHAQYNSSRRKAPLSPNDSSRLLIMNGLRKAGFLCGGGKEPSETRLRSDDVLHGEQHSAFKNAWESIKSAIFLQVRLASRLLNACGYGLVVFRLQAGEHICGSMKLCPQANHEVRST
jgi:hypothetical protein